MEGETQLAKLNEFMKQRDPALRGVGGAGGDIETASMSGKESSLGRTAKSGANRH